MVVSAAWEVPMAAVTERAANVAGLHPMDGPQVRIQQEVVPQVRLFLLHPSQVVVVDRRHL